MKPILQMLIAFTLIVGVGAVIVTRSNSQQQQVESLVHDNDSNTIRGKVKRAKEKGRKVVNIPSPIPLYAEVDSLDEALSQTMAVVAMPIEKKSMLLDPETIVTFYRLRVIETLSQNILPDCCAPKSIPSELPSLNMGEIYLQVGGGSVTIDDVMVAEKEEFGGLRLSQQYLIFLSQNPSLSIAMVRLGAGGIFKVNDDSSLEAITPSIGSGKERSLNSVKSPLQRDLENLHGNSLRQLKANIKGVRLRQN
ncbi:MAG: hypothetical protein L0226_16845 [Acidobacteria bacterium]|nr:hypothetical protein [Acidobacteriota bacterium]